MVTVNEINLGEDCIRVDWRKNLGCYGAGIDRAWICWRDIGRQLPSYLGTICKDEAQGL